MREAILEQRARRSRPCLWQREIKSLQFWMRKQRSRRRSRAEAKKEATIREAEGQAEAILKIQQANADGLRMIKEAAPDQSVIQLKSLEAFAKAADGKATKIIIPSEIQGIAGLVKSVTEVAAGEK